jgi:hypothetical protein
MKYSNITPQQGVSNMIMSGREKIINGYFDEQNPGLYLESQRIALVGETGMLTMYQYLRDQDLPHVDLIGMPEVSMPGMRRDRDSRWHIQSGKKDIKADYVVFSVESLAVGYVCIPRRVKCGIRIAALFGRQLPASDMVMSVDEADGAVSMPGYRDGLGLFVARGDGDATTANYSYRRMLTSMAKQAHTRFWDRLARGYEGSYWPKD